MWAAVEDGDAERRYQWVPVSEAVAKALGAETGQTRKLDLADAELARQREVQTVAAVITEGRAANAALNTLYRCCETMSQRAVQRHRHPLRGLGFGEVEDRRDLVPPPLPRDPEARKVEAARRDLEYYMNKRWVAATVEGAAVAPMADGPPEPAMVAKVEGGVSATTVGSDPNVAEDDVTEAPLMPYPPHCLYVADLVVCREPRPNEIGQGPTHYVVDMALTVRKALGDSGAGPSVITTKLLELLPADACVYRDLKAKPLPAAGPDGRLLVQHGTATLIFQLAGVACRHSFLVVEGAASQSEGTALNAAPIGLGVDTPVEGGERIAYSSFELGADRLRLDFDVASGAASKN